MSLIGFTTSIPFEVIHSAEHTGIDLNNIFITDPDPNSLIEFSEKRGLPITLCSWIKGMYAVLSRRSDIDKVVAVVSGDCSNTLPLVDLLRSEGREVITFAYPYDRDRDMLAHEIEKLCKHFSTSLVKVQESMHYLDLIREKADRVDYLTWSEGKVTGFENHYYLVNTSDFKGSPAEYDKEISDFITQAQSRPSVRNFIPLAVVGVPPIFPDLYDFVESRGGRIVYNETQRQFTMPLRNPDIVSRYLEYAYPYSLLYRLTDIQNCVEQRGVRGIIHYTQSFCHHQMDHMLLKEKIGLPVLMLEGDRPISLDERTRLRIESFLEMLE